ncbi:hypothetical protein HK101_005148 [Irineochytrium annulatum]|nr:hypothetical protein HK101_005148 [Irineochytrium annulatum]
MTTATPPAVRYCLLVKQQPARCKASGLAAGSLGNGAGIGVGGMSRVQGGHHSRPLDPALVVQLGVLLPDGNLDTGLASLGDVSRFVAHAVLMSEDGKEDCGRVYLNQSGGFAGVGGDGGPPWMGGPGGLGRKGSMGNEDDPLSALHPRKRFAQSIDTSVAANAARDAIARGWERSLTGAVVSSCHLLSDLSGRRGAYFVWPDLGIAAEGRWRLKCVLSNLSAGFMEARISGTSLAGVDGGVKRMMEQGGSSEGVRCAAMVLATCMTDVVVSLGVTEWVGSQQSSELAKHFAEQGLRMPVKRKTKVRFNPRGSGPITAITPSHGGATG